ncbi:MAG: hypothetical protein K0S07_175 [Chlamydiales bacterium]|jgi:TolA-binding protein|nr:hypothetical protein [Chlamydiales bacterium]
MSFSLKHTALSFLFFTASWLNALPEAPPASWQSFQEGLLAANRAIEKEQIEEAIYILSAMIQKATSQGDREPVSFLQLKLAHLYNQIGLTDQAAALFIESLKDYPSSAKDSAFVQATFALAKILYQKGELEESFDLLYQLNQLSVPFGEEDKRLFFTVQEKLDARYQRMLIEAEKLFNEEKYAASSPLLQDIFTASLSLHFPLSLNREGPFAFLSFKIGHRLAKSYYLSQNYSQVVHTILSFPPLPDNALELSDLLVDCRYLLALSYRKLGEYQAAIDVLRRLKVEEGREDLAFSDELDLEMALCYLGLFDLKRAKFSLEALALGGKNSSATRQAKVELAGLLGQLGHFEESEQQLRRMQAKLPPIDPLQKKILFFLAANAFSQKQYWRAAELYQKSLEPSSEWHPQALYNLGDCYYKLARQCADRTLAAHYIQQANALFERGIDGPLKSENYRRIADLLAFQMKELQDETALEQLKGRIESLLEEKSPLLPDLLLVLGKISPSSREREETLLFLTDNFPESHAAPEAWALLGDLYGEGSEEKEALAKAIHCYSRSFYLYYQQPALGKAGEMLLKQALALREMKDPESLWRAYVEIQSLIDIHTDLLHKMKDPARVYFELAKSALELPLALQSKETIESAKESLLILINRYGNESYALKAKYLLASLFFQMQEYELSFIYFKQYAEASKDETAGDAWHFAALSAIEIGYSVPTIQECLKMSFERFPQGHYADSDYLSYYPEEAYLMERPQALNHLLAFPRTFPQSPLIALQQCWLGKIEEAKSVVLDPLERLQRLKEAKCRFSQALSLITLPPADEALERAYLASCMGYSRSSINIHYLEASFGQDSSLPIDVMLALTQSLPLLNEEERRQNLWLQLEYDKISGLLTERGRVIEEILKEMKQKKGPLSAITLEKGIFFFDQQLWKKALPLFQTASRQKEASLEVFLLAKLYEAETLAQLKKWSKALQTLERAQEKSIDPTFQQALQDKKEEIQQRQKSR